MYVDNAHNGYNCLTSKKNRLGHNGYINNANIDI